MNAPLTAQTSSAFRDGTLRITVLGPIEGAAGIDLAEVRNPRALAIEVDVSALPLPPSPTIGWIIRTYQASRPRPFRVVGASPRFVQVLRALGLADLLDVRNA